MDTTAKALGKVINRAVRARLAWRLALVGVIASVLGAAAVIAREKVEFRKQAVSQAIQHTRAVETLAGEYLEWHGSLDWKNLQSLLDRYVGRLKMGGDEQIARMEILDRNHLSQSKYSTETPEQSSLLTDERLNKALQGEMGDARHGSLVLDGERFIVVQIPIPYHNGEIIGHSRTIFQVMPDTLAALWRRVRFTILLMLALVAGVVLVLHPIISRGVERLALSSAELLNSNLGMLEALGSAIAKRDSDTDAHNYRATLYAIRLGESLGFDPPAMRSLIKGALLHDVGKIGIRDDILLKPGHLTDEEFGKMKSHVKHGMEIIDRAEWLLDSMAVVGFHHEKYDGSGYEHGLAGKQIPLSARVFAVADVFDALVSKRPYKIPMTLEQAQEILKKGRGTHFAPEVADAFIEMSATLYDEYATVDVQTLKAILAEKLRYYFYEDARHVLVGDKVAEPI